MPEEAQPFAGSIVGVWSSVSSGKPVIIVEDANGRTYEIKAREVWPGKQVKGVDDEQV